MLGGEAGAGRERMGMRRVYGIGYKRRSDSGIG
jgi:hypothetical protein